MNNNDQLDELLRKLSSRPVPPLGANFQYEVWRQIRQRQTTAKPWSFRQIFNWLLSDGVRPQPVMAALTLALVLGVFTGLPLAKASNHAVRLDAFSMNAPGMFSLSIK
ncbi:MAG: hypothetical protein LBH01_12005 [Verrucomicrobiales bacterium]|nr:hypothetical protein [Verrucomicrobiales bacterium]